jgi:SOS-response transcriptional repressor LexA
VTKRQAEVVQTIVKLTERCGFPPTIREVAAKLKTLPSNVHQILGRLRSAGLVEWNDHKIRTLRVVR